ncbi:7-carboxy-7-deazaguanine synthase QueE [Sinimarinibacterium sp. NLF-5-8]|uniref:7-carboxy-7-deazaguanine synthase QueE n=1 Tax=Sinimarinibacterium sp. NLF-5-8 TaxID=2698684 RepID=UPI00137BA80E|nr:7-carboxy-7-deazaguanine synthase QueE [Sinimarinibacterium sp. NLF-5-8]
MNQAVAAEGRLKITEIFRSLQGESSSVGWPTVFVRLTGCPLRCTYCDTAYAFHGGQWMSKARILEAVAAFNTHHVCVTGGEPLAQKNCIALLSALCDAGYHVSLETSGALDIAHVDPRVRRVVDLKTPNSGEMHRNHWPNLECLSSHDELKFVIGDRADYEWARQALVEHALNQRCTVLFSPSQGLLEPGQLADWLLADQLPVRFQLQLHKVLWGNVPGR